MVPNNPLWQRKFHAYSILLSAVLSLPLSCNHMSPTNAGSVTEGGNVEVASGQIVDDAGLPDANAEVLLVPAGYTPGDNVLHEKIQYDTTDASGYYRFLNIDAGRYSIQAVHTIKRTMALNTGIRITRTSNSISKITLRMPGALRVILPDTVDTVNGYVFVPGTTIFRHIPGNVNPFVIDSVPPGMVGGLYYAKQNSTNPASLLRDSITVTPGETAVVAFTAWRYAKKIHLNTTSSGAGISAPVINFPVLIRLTRAVFNFAQAKADGGDVRFTKVDNTELPYEIERWDATNGFAEIWVRTDTIYGNNATQSITMYWGNSAAANASNGPAVFDTAKGFQGVWHMGQAGNTPANDATINHFTGSPSGMTAASAVPGMIGISQNFSSPTSYIRMQNTASSALDFPDYDNFTLSAWVHPDSLDGKFHYLLSKGECRYHCAQFSGDTAEWHFDFYNNQLAQGEFMMGGIVEKKWTHFVGVYRGSSAALYVDGICVDSVINSDPRPLDATKYDLIIGARAELLNGNFRGKIDEVRLSNVSSSIDWVRLCYMNQKTDDALVVFR